MFLITIEWVHTLNLTFVGVASTRELAQSYVNKQIKLGSPGPLGTFVIVEVKLLDTEV